MSNGKNCHIEVLRGGCIVKAHRMSFKIDYLGKVNFILETSLRCESGNHEGTFNKNTPEVKKSYSNLLLSLRGIDKCFKIYRHKKFKGTVSPVKDRLKLVQLNRH
jgi:hypothetical protein